MSENLSKNEQSNEMIIERSQINEIQDFKELI